MWVLRIVHATFIYLSVSCEFYKSIYVYMFFWVFIYILYYCNVILVLYYTYVYVYNMPYDICYNVLIMYLLVKADSISQSWIDIVYSIIIISIVGVKKQIHNDLSNWLYANALYMPFIEWNDKFLGISSIF